MNLTHLTYRLKTSPIVHKMSFESWEEAMNFLVANDIQKVVGKLEGIKSPGPILEAAAKNVKADWFEFSHTEEA
jgi:hypothetical protein